MDGCGTRIVSTRRETLSFKSLAPGSVFFPQRTFYSAFLDIDNSVRGSDDVPLQYSASALPIVVLIGLFYRLASLYAASRIILETKRRSTVMSTRSEEMGGERKRLTLKEEGAVSFLSPAFPVPLPVFKLLD